MSTEPELTEPGSPVASACNPPMTPDQRQRLAELKAKRPHLDRREVIELEQLLEVDFEESIARTLSSV